MENRRALSLVTLVSARPDGATTLAAALAAVWSATDRTLLIDLNLDHPEVAPLLDIGEGKTIYHLAFNAQLAPVSAADLEDHLSWHEGMAVIGGIARADQRSAIADHFVNALIERAVGSFDRVVVDLGRVRPSLPESIAKGAVLWAVGPGPLGVAAVERASIELQEAGSAWPASSTLVLNRCGAHDFVGVDRFLVREYGMEVIGQVPEAPNFVKSIELSHSLRALSVPDPDDHGFTRRYGEQALAMRRAIEAVAAAVPRTRFVAEVAGGS